MKAPDQKNEHRRLHPLPRGLVELYGLIAVLVVLIPEWLADGTLSVGAANGAEPLPARGRAWRTLPELRVASMNLLEIRRLCRQLHMFGYASQNRDQLTRRLLRRSRRRNLL